MRSWQSHLSGPQFSGLCSGNGNLSHRILKVLPEVQGRLRVAVGTQLGQAPRHPSLQRCQDGRAFGGEEWVLVMGWVPGQHRAPRSRRREDGGAGGGPSPTQALKSWPERQRDGPGPRSGELGGHKLDEGLDLHPRTPPREMPAGRQVLFQKGRPGGFSGHTEGPGRPWALIPHSKAAESSRAQLCTA